MEETTTSTAPAVTAVPAPTTPETDAVAEVAAPAASPPPVASAATSVRHGRSLTFAVPDDCVDPQFGTLDPGNEVIVDADVDPRTFTVQTAGLRLGSYLLNVECQNAVGVQSEMMIFRQNGAKRGGASSVVTAGTLGLGSAIALVGLPGALAGPTRRRSTSTDAPPASR